MGDGKAQKDEEEEEEFISQLNDLPDPPSPCLPPPSPCRPPPRPCRPPPPRPPPPPCPTPPVPSSCIFWKGKSGGSVVRPGYETRTPTLSQLLPLPAIPCQYSAINNARPDHCAPCSLRQQCKIRKIDFKSLCY